MKLTKHVYLVGGGSFGLSHSFDCSVYIVDCLDELVMIDSGAGCAADKIVTNIEEDGLDPSNLRHLLLTHVHADHAGGACYLHNRFNVNVHVSEAESRILEQGDENDLYLPLARRSGFYSDEYTFYNCRETVRLNHGALLSFGRFTFHALNVPGHSRGSICYAVDLPEGRAVFTGDTVFPNGTIGLLNCDGSELCDYRKYLGRLSGLKCSMLFPGHGLFILEEGQAHLDLAVNLLQKLQVPRSFI